MCWRRARVWLLFTVSALMVSGSALAQIPTLPIPSINTVQCRALTILAPDPQKVALDMATAAAAAAVKAATAASATPASIESAAKIAAKAAAAEVNSAAFKLPQPKLKQGATAE